MEEYLQDLRNRDRQFDSEGNRKGLHKKPREERGVSKNARGRAAARDCFILDKGRKPEDLGEVRDYHKRKTKGHKESIATADSFRGESSESIVNNLEGLAVRLKEELVDKFGTELGGKFYENILARQDYFRGLNYHDINSMTSVEVRLHLKVSPRMALVGFSAYWFDESVRAEYLSIIAEAEGYEAFVVSRRFAESETVEFGKIEKGKGKV